VEHEEKRDVPKTIGELRQRLAELGNPWEVDPRLNDDDPLPDPPRGGQREEDIPEEARLPTLDPDTDLHAVISGEQPANPFLRTRWEEAGLLSQDKDEDEGGGG
jgi:hypothetical protein